MRILADENIPRAAVDMLRRAGHDVAWVSEEAPGSDDSDVLKKATEQDRVVVTFDKDFGDLAYVMGLPATCGIILFNQAVRIPREFELPGTRPSCGGRENG